MNSNRLLGLGLVLLVAGMVMLTAASLSQGNGSAGGFILIGPFPVVFGSGEKGGQLPLVSVVLGAIMLLILFLMSRRFASLTREGTSETDK